VWLEREREGKQVWKECVPLPPPGASDKEITELSPSEVTQAVIRRVKENWKEEDK